MAHVVGYWHSYVCIGGAPNADAWASVRPHARTHTHTRTHGRSLARHAHILDAPRVRGICLPQSFEKQLAATAREAVLARAARREETADHDAADAKAPADTAHAAVHAQREDVPAVSESCQDESSPPTPSTPSKLAQV